MARRGFTLIEALVVIGIIGILITIAFPVFNGVIEQSRASTSIANLRQWGAANASFLNDNDQVLPWEGLDGEMMMTTNFEEDLWWANALAPYVNEPRYADLSDDAVAAGEAVPGPESRKSIWVDPTAQGEPVTGDMKEYYFTYVMNESLNDQFYELYTDPSGNAYTAGDDYPVELRLRMSQVKEPAKTAFMFEKRTIMDEIDAMHPYHPLDVQFTQRGNWQHFTARHNDGGHIVRLDGSVERFDFARVTTPIGGAEMPVAGASTMEDWNQPGLIWNPLGPAVQYDP
ncbi:MAG: prepilin-type N-terminal cleavage/methylation domain-containing protein [Planctomycetota bacterium]